MGLLAEGCSGGFKFSWPQVEIKQDHGNKIPQRLLGATMCSNGSLR